MKQIILNEEQLKALDSFLQEMPMKYGMPIVNFINEIIIAQEKKESEAE
jgi:hypothetical protein